MKELVIKKCLKCGAIVKVVEDCNCDDCGIRCCNEKMVTLKPNSVDASFEKHVPSYEVVGNDLIVKVDHVMDKDHLIEWIAFVNENREEFAYLKHSTEAKAVFKNEKGILYAYCNKHGLWRKEI